MTCSRIDDIPNQCFEFLEYVDKNAKGVLDGMDLSPMKPNPRYVFKSDIPPTVLTTDVLQTCLSYGLISQTTRFTVTPPYTREGWVIFGCNFTGIRFNPYGPGIEIWSAESSIRRIEEAISREHPLNEETLQIYDRLGNMNFRNDDMYVYAPTKKGLSLLAEWRLHQNAAEREEQEREERIEKPGTKKRPPKEAFMAYHLHKVMGVKQEDVADRLTEKFKKPFKRHHIPRLWMKVRDYIDSGGSIPVLTEKDSGRSPEFIPMNPAILDNRKRQRKDITRKPL